MSLSNEEMISNIRQKLNIVNQALLNPEKFKSTPHQDISEIYEFVTVSYTHLTLPTIYSV